MDEKKTFKNVELGTYDPSPNTPWAWTASGYRFPHTEWDMDVTFTKRVKPEVGGTCRRVGWYDKVYTIIAVYADMAWIWGLTDTAEDSRGWIEPISCLEDFKPWNPA